jgi:UDP-glucose 4-epimerase
VPDGGFLSYFVTGAAGFIGSNMCDALLARGERVVGYDNFSSGMPEFVEEAARSERFALVRGDLLDTAALTAAMSGADVVIHLAANADVRFGLDHPGRDLEQNTIGTFNVLEAMRANKVKTVCFSSTGSVYGEAEVIPTPETAPFPIQTSLYGASKLAGEALISSYAEGFGVRGLIFRFVSILGERYTHGHVFDFCRSLQNQPEKLTILGDGRQRKSYLYVADCVSAILTALDNTSAKISIYNLGTNEYCEVSDSAAWIASKMGFSPEYEFTGGARGWVGDNPFIFLDTRKIRELGWEPTLSIRAGVERTVDWLMDNPWVFERRRC